MPPRRRSPCNEDSFAASNRIRRGGRNAYFYGAAAARLSVTYCLTALFVQSEADLRICTALIVLALFKLHVRLLHLELGQRNMYQYM